MEAEKELSLVDSKIKNLKSDIRLENIETICEIDGWMEGWMDGWIDGWMDG